MSSQGIMSQDNGGWKVALVSTILVFLQILMVCGRIASRRLKKTRLARDDYMLIIGAVLTFVLCALAIAYPRIAVAVPYRDPEHLGKSTETSVNKAYIAWSVIYGLTIATSKWAILLLYRRVFTTPNPWFSATVITMGTIITLTAILNTFISIFYCSPVKSVWDSNVEPRTCVDIVKFNQFMTIPNVVTGMVMLAMPLPAVFRLNVAALQKIALAATFLHGVIGVVASYARLIDLFSNSSAILSNSQSLSRTIWTINEPANYIIAACLPTLRPIFVRFLPASFFVLSKQRNSSGSYNKPFTSSLRISWPRGSMTPKFRIEKERFAEGSGNGDSGRSGSAPWIAGRQGSGDIGKMTGVRDVEKGMEKWLGGSAGGAGRRGISESRAGGSRAASEIMEKKRLDDGGKEMEFGGGDGCVVDVREKSGSSSAASTPLWAEHRCLFAKVITRGEDDIEVEPSGGGESMRL